MGPGCVALVMHSSCEICTVKSKRLSLFFADQHFDFSAKEDPMKVIASSNYFVTDFVI